MSKISKDNLSIIENISKSIIVADAACLGTHWIYDLEKLAAKCPDGVKGFEQPDDNHYHAGKNSGDSTHYGEIATGKSLSDELAKEPFGWSLDVVRLLLLPPQSCPRNGSRLREQLRFRSMRTHRCRHHAA